MYMHDANTSLCACTALRKATRAITRIYDARLASHGVNVNQFAMLRHIARAGDIALSRLAAQLVMDRTTLYRVLRPVEQAGWVETFPEAKGRGRRVRLTAGGEALLAGATADWQACQDDVRAHLGDDGWDRLYAASAAVLALEGDR